MDKIAEKTVTLTKEEFTEYLSFFHRKSFGGNYAVLYGCAIMLFAIGLIYPFIFNFAGWQIPIILAVISLYLFLDVIFFIPQNIKKDAQKETDEQKPYTVVIYSDHIVDIPIIGREPSYTEINIPIAQLFGAFETDNLLVFMVDTRRTIILPKRLLDSEQLNLIRDTVKIG